MKWPQALAYIVLCICITAIMGIGMWGVVNDHSAEIHHCGELAPEAQAACVQAISR